MNEEENAKEIEKLKRVVADHERLIRRYLRAFFIAAAYAIGKFIIYIGSLIKVFFKMIF